ncbi:MAG: hypothetical protein Tsb0013_12950 [Phycisphaerales bacterium]
MRHARVFLMAPMVPLVLAQVACDRPAPPTTSGTTPVAFHVAAQSAPRDAETLYRDYCLRCHGADDDGGMSSSLIDERWLYAKTDQQRYDATSLGIIDAGMPAFGDVLTPKEIENVLALLDTPERIRAMGRADVPDDDRPEKVRTRHYVLDVEPWVGGDLEIPWAICFIDDTTALVTERPGGLRLVVDGWLHPDPIRNTPDVLHAGQGGLMDVNIDPDYEENGWIYLSYSHALQPGSRWSPAHTRIVRGRIENHTWVDEQVLFQAPDADYGRTRHHYGSRIVFDEQGMLYFAIGDRGERTPAQDLASAKGKVHRIHPDGRVPDDNPFVSDPDALHTVWSYGHRNTQGMAFHPENGDLWTIEHGPRGGDEVNIIRPGKDYGWPTITYGINYNGTIITHRMRAEGMEQPTYYWEPSIAVCGSEFVTGDEFPKWNNDFIATGLVTEQVHRLVNADDRVIHDEMILKGYGRVRDVGFDSAGVMYIVTNDPHRVWRITNAGPAQPR